MQLAQLLPLVGGGVPLIIGVSLIYARGFKERSQIFFFLSLVCLGLFAFLEGLAYLIDSQNVAEMLILASKYFAFSGLYMVYGFSLALRGKEDPMRTLLPLVVGWLFIAPFYTIDSIVRTQWGWAVALNQPILVLTFLWVFYFLSMSLGELVGVINELKEAKNPFYKNMQLIAAGFFLWTVLAVGTSIVVNMLTVQTFRPLFSILHIFPTLIVTYGFVTQK